MNHTPEINLNSLHVPVDKSCIYYSLARAPWDFINPCWNFPFCSMCRDWCKSIMKGFWILRGNNTPYIWAEGDTEFLTSISTTSIEEGRTYKSLIGSFLLSLPLLNNNQTLLCGFMLENIWRTCGSLLSSAGCLHWFSVFPVIPVVVVSLNIFSCTCRYQSQQVLHSSMQIYRHSALKLTSGISKGILSLLRRLCGSDLCSDAIAVTSVVIQ